MTKYDVHDKGQAFLILTKLIPASESRPARKHSTNQLQFETSPSSIHEARYDGRPSCKIAPRLQIVLTRHGWTLCHWELDKLKPPQANIHGTFD